MTRFRRSNHVRLTRAEVGRRLTSAFGFTMGGKLLPVVRVARYLGLMFAGNLSWEPHIEALCEKVRGAVFAITRLTRGGSQREPGPRVVRMLVKAMVLPIISYGAHVWSPATRLRCSPPPRPMQLTCACCPRRPTSCSHSSHLRYDPCLAPCLYSPCVSVA